MAIFWHQSTCFELHRLRNLMLKTFSIIVDWKTFLSDNVCVKFSHLNFVNTQLYRQNFMLSCTKETLCSLSFDNMQRF